jgi:hypothetical protein
MSHCVLTEIDEPFAPYPKEALFLNAANDKEKNFVFVRKTLEYGKYYAIIILIK